MIAAPSRAEDQARRLLETFPWRVRLERGDEIVATTLDSLPPGADRLPLATAFDLARGGFRIRRQNRPPLPTRISYRLGARIHPRWLRWVFDDLIDPGYVRRTRRQLASFWFAFGIGMVAFLGSSALPTAVMVAAISLPMSVRRAALERNRDRMLARHGLTPAGLDPGVTWVRFHRRRLVPNASIASVVTIGGLTALAVGTMALAAIGLQSPVRLASPEVTLWAEPAPDGVVARAVPLLLVTAGVTAAGLLALGIATWRRQVQDRPAARPGRATTPTPATPATSDRFRVAVVAAVAITVGAGAVAAVTLRFAWWSWTAGLALGCLGAAGAVAAIVGVVLGVTERVAGRPPVRLWTVLPRVGPASR